MIFDTTTSKELCLNNIKAIWIEEELSLLKKYIEQGISLEDTSAFFNRSVPSIISKANRLGYGYKTNKTDGLKYFTENINHKNRRTKAEMHEGKEFLSLATENKDSQRTDNEVDTVIIPKVEINLIDIDIAIQILTMARDNAVQMRTRGNAVGGSNET